MNRTYGEPVDVDARADGRPVRFAWRGQEYTVREILEHWVIARQWWQGAQADPRQPDLEFWRIEACAQTQAPEEPAAGTRANARAHQGTQAHARVYELLREVATGAWTLRG
jgi:hypothetical protein